MSAFAQQSRYPVPSAFATAFTADEIREIRGVFGGFDSNGDGSIDAGELFDAFQKLGENVKKEDIPKLLDEMDLNHDEKISFEEFITYIHSLRHESKNSQMGSMLKKSVGFLKVEGAGGAQHTFSEEEKMAFAKHINNSLSSDPAAARHLPLDVSSNQLFERTGDGILFCKLINLAVPDTIDERAINKKENMNVYQKTENLNLALNAAKGIGCQIINIGAADLIEGRPILVLGLLWQIIKIQLLSQISLKNYPELVLLLQEGEDMAALMKLPPEDILLRWFNYHLIKAGTDRRVTNFGNDLKDSVCYSYLLNQLNSACTLANEADHNARAEHVIDNAKRLGAQVFIKAADIVGANKKLNMSFVAQLFNTCPGLVVTQEQISSYDFASLELDDAGDSREERVFRMWINSLNIPELYINNLFEDLCDGIAILKIQDVIRPGIVNWKKVNLNAQSRFKLVENGNTVVNNCKTLGFSMVNIGGIDIVDKKKKLILAIIWQLMRMYTLGVLAKLAANQGITDITDDHVVNWANQKVAASGKSSSMKNFKDSSLKSGLFFLDLVNAIEPRAVNWELVTAGTTDDEKFSNSKYAISIARKIGACVFLTPEDIVEVKSKMLLTFVASLWATDLTYVSH